LAWLNHRRPDQWRQKPEGSGLDQDQLISLLDGLRSAARANV
jgi:hypothetical protein